MSVFPFEVPMSGRSLLTETHNKRAFCPAGHLTKDCTLHASSIERLCSICQLQKAFTKAQSPSVCRA